MLKLPSDDQLSNLNLLAGFKPDIDWLQSSKSKLDSLLEIIKLRGINPFDNDFIVMRGYLKTIMTTMFLTREKWRIGASKFKNTIFIGSYRRKEPSHSNSLESNQQAFRHYNLRNLLTTPGSSGREDSDNIALKDEYISVFQSELRRRNESSFKLLYAGELDALFEPESDPNRLENYVNIKMTTEEKNDKQKNIFERLKLVQWWSVSVLSGCSKIVVAKRDNEFNIRGFEELKVDSIPRICYKYYDRNRALNVMAIDYLYQFLRRVQIVMNNEHNPKVVYLFEYNINDKLIDSFRIDEDFVESRLIPDWFIDDFQHLQPTQNDDRNSADEYLDKE